MSPSNFISRFGQLEADPPGQQRDDQLVEGDALLSGERDELFVECRGAPDQDSAVGVHGRNNIACAIDIASSACDITPMDRKPRTPKQQARFDAATARAVRVAQDRHRRIENARIAKLEQQVIDNFIGDIATYVGAKA